MLNSTSREFLHDSFATRYWGQNSAGSQQNLASYCGSDSVVDVLVIAFMTSFAASPSINFANVCLKFLPTHKLSTSILFY